jgi:hypothetical protein
MGTSSHIGILMDDGTVEAIYCHWDGYPSGVGRILKAHYSDRQRALELLDLGDISVLEALLSTSLPHSFEKPQPGVTIAYHRDRGEALKEPRIYENQHWYCRKGEVDYNYLLKEDGWHCYGSRGEYEIP